MPKAPPNPYSLSAMRTNAKRLAPKSKPRKNKKHTKMKHRLSGRKRKKMPMKQSGRFSFKSSSTRKKTKPKKKQKKVASLPKGTCVVGAFGNTVTLSSDTPSNQQRVVDFALSSATNSAKDAYFETQLTKLPVGCCVALGFVTSSNVSTLPVDTLPGWDRHTVGVHTDDGGVYLGGNDQQPVAHVPRTFKEGDVIGVGLLDGVGFYVTCNGSRVWREHVPSSSSKTKSKSTRDVAVGLCGMDHTDAIIVLHKEAMHPVASARK